MSGKDIKNTSHIPPRANYHNEANAEQPTIMCANNAEIQSKISSVRNQR